MEISCFIEMPMFTKYKYELKHGRYVLDRPVKTHVPTNYGFINSTLAEDGDALDVFVLASDRINPTAWVTAEVIGVFTCLDKGVKDHKVIAVLKGDKVRNPEKEIKYVKEYLETYKKGFKVLKYLNKKQAKKIIKECQTRRKNENV